MLDLLSFSFYDKVSSHPRRPARTREGAISEGSNSLQNEGLALVGREQLLLSSNVVLLSLLHSWAGGSSERRQTFENMTWADLNIHKLIITAQLPI